jgi:hypothetical protein
VRICRPCCDPPLGGLCRPLGAGELGQLILSWDGCGGLTALRADARIAVSRLLLRDWHLMTPAWLTMSCRSGDHLGDIIRISASPRLAYVITQDNGAVLEARWPD